MRGLLQSLIRIFAFVSKEISEILRQPRLIISLVLGPFLILLVFGIGYRNEPRALRTVFVAPESSGLTEEIAENAPNLGPQLIYLGTTADENQAIDALKRGEADLVVVAPEDAYGAIQDNTQAVFTLFHYEIDPFQVDYVNYFGQFYVDVINKRVLMEITAEGQAEASTLQEDLRAARESAAAARLAFEAGDEAAAQQHQQELSQNVDAVSLAVGASLGLLDTVRANVGGGDGSGETQEIVDALTRVQEGSSNLGSSSAGEPSGRAQQAAEVEADLALLEERLGQFQSIQPSVLVSPFRAETQSIAAVQPTPQSYFAPAVVALLLQHLAVTFAALSIVRERTIGTVELFRVSPLTALEALIGKYLSYMLFGGVIAAVLALLLVYVLGVPMLGHWWNFTLVVAALLFSSLSIGFLISIISETDSQAVQYSMFALLAAVFFSGFILNLDAIWEPVRVLSWMIPATYGTILLRDIALRGAGVDPLLIGGLAAIGAALAIISWLLLRRLISSVVGGR